MEKMWTDERIEQLRQMWQEGKSDEEIAAIFNTTAKSIEYQRIKHGFVKYRKHFKKWTNEEVELLKRLAPNHTYTEIANILGRSFGSVQDKAKGLHIEVKREHSPASVFGERALGEEYLNMGNGPHRNYTKTTDMLIVQYLSEGYPLQYIATELNRDYDDLKRYCEQNAERLHKAHMKMLAYGGVYAERLKKRKGEIA